MGTDLPPTKPVLPSADPVLPSANGRDDRRALAGGCLLSLGSAFVTCLMLFINGSLVLAFLATFAGSGPAWMSNPRFAQFMLFLLPVVLAVVQWMMIDYVRSKFRQRPDV